jgi:hypothetical protein
MHPELLSVLAAEHRRDLVASSRAARGPSPAVARRPTSRRAIPRFRVTWTRTTLAAVADRRRARSLVIVISATRTR